MTLIMDFLVGAALGVNLTMIWYNWRQIRRQAQLEVLLSHLCFDAFLNAHLPVWQCWAQAFGHTFTITLDPVKPESEKGRRP